MNQEVKEQSAEEPKEDVLRNKFMKKIVKAAVTGKKSDKILGSVSAADLLDKVQSQIEKLSPKSFLESRLTKNSSVIESRASDKK